MTRDEAQARCIIAWKLASPSAVRAALFDAQRQPMTPGPGGADLCALLFRYQRLSQAQVEQVRNAVEFAVTSGQLTLDAEAPRAPPRKLAPIGRSAESIAEDGRFQDRVGTVRFDSMSLQAQDEAELEETSGPGRAEVDRYMGLRFSRFKILGEVASGAMGIILRAWSLEARKVVALKLLFDDVASDATLFARFRRESKILQKLSHPHIVRVIGHGYELDKQPYLAMEFIIGKTLKDLVERRLKVDGHSAPSQIIAMLTPIAHALAYCHEQGLIHRDIKPTNIVIDSSTGRPVLVDFGLVKRTANVLTTSVHAELSRRGEILGTPAYMSPEQVTGEGEDITEAVDAWGFGATLFFALSGLTPFEESNSIAALVATLQRDPQRLRSLAPDAPAWLDELCHACLQRDPLARPGLSEIASRLERGF